MPSLEPASDSRWSTELVALHGGTVSVSSGDLAPGAVFTVTLPLGAVDAVSDSGEAVVKVDLDATPEDHGEAAEAALGDANADDVATLLIVDDSADLRAFVRDQFEGPFRVLEAANGAEGIERLAANCLTWS